MENYFAADSRTESITHFPLLEKDMGTLYKVKAVVKQTRFIVMKAFDLSRSVLFTQIIPLGTRLRVRTIT
jgi:hypothetical protein